jgi:hypothetical protein
MKKIVSSQKKDEDPLRRYENLTNLVKKSKNCNKIRVKRILYATAKLKEG